MSIVSRTQNIVIEPIVARWGNQETTAVQVIGDTASDLAGKYFDMEAIDIALVKTEYRVWLDDGIESAPTSGGKTLVPVVYAPNDSAAVLAGKIVAVLDALTGVNAIARPNGVIVIQNAEMGEVAEIVDGAALAGTGFTFTQLKAGSRLDIGFIDGDVELGVTENLVDVTTHQTGAEVIAQLRNGITVGPISMALKEATAAKLREIASVIGKKATVNGKEVVKLGGSKQFTNVLTDARKLVLHPQRLPLTNQDEDYCAWLAYPNLEGVVFSGENNKLINVTFNTFLDDLIELDARNGIICGDTSQNYLSAINA